VDADIVENLPVDVETDFEGETKEIVTHVRCKVGFRNQVFSGFERCGESEVGMLMGACSGKGYI
jgi:hypothetical protein